MIPTAVRTSPLEAALTGLWSAALGVTRVGPDDDFFALGGDASLLSTLLDNIHLLFGVRLQADAIGARATVATMLRMIERARKSHPATPQRHDDAASDRRSVYPLSATQRRMWFLAKLDPHSNAYSQRRTWELRGALDVDALRRGCELVVKRHATLRTHYIVLDDEPQQRLADEFSLDFAVIDLTGLPEASREQAAASIVADAAAAPIDFTGGQPMRVRLLRMEAERHLLLRGMHHIATDGWSGTVFERELSTAYAAYAAGLEPELAALPMQYADYALWQREWLRTEALQRELAYWQSKLAGLSTLELPTDRPRPALQSYRGGRCVFHLPRELTEALKRVGQREGATFFMVVLGAFQVLLHRYSGQEDIVVGTPIAARRRTELEPLIGFFANTLVLRTALDGNPRFVQLLARVRETALGAYTHQDLPFEKLVEELAPARDLSRNPLFQVVLSLQNVPAEPFVLGALDVEQLPYQGMSAKFDLMLTVRETGEGLRTSWEYAADLFDAPTIERMAASFQVLLEGIVADPQCPIGELPLLGAAEREKLLVDWNDTGAAYPATQCIHALFEAQAARTPQAQALLCADEQLSYAELNARANQLAHRLIAMGVGPEVLVGVCLERSAELVIALLAILKAGGAYVPLDAAYPCERLGFMLADTQAPVLISTTALVERLASYRGKLLCLDRDQHLYDTHPRTNPQSAARPDNLAYVIYTSGSTGKPKGVMITHANVTRLFAATHGWFKFDARDVWTCFHSCAFDFSVWEIWGALVYGGKLVMVPYLMSRDPEAFHALLRRERVTVLNQTPTAFQQLIAADIAAGAVSDLALRLVIFGGEALDCKSLRPWYERHGDTEPQLVNMYGITETTVHVTYQPIRASDVGDARGSVIGTPIPDLRIYILDRHRNPVPIGVAGELHVGGAGLARGYLNREALSAERFLPDPFSTVPGARMYASGDLARYLPDGSIEYLGRIDEQVKIRGFRIEPGEIESVLGEQRALRQAVVIAREDTPGDKRLVAYLVPAPGASVDLDALRAALRERLPEYMRPSAFVTLEQLPLTANGKIDRKALPAPSTAREAAAQFVAARSAIEALVAEVWCEVLKLEQASVHDNFFDLGGHSLLAAQVVTRLNRCLDVELPLRSMFESGTIAELAAVVAAMRPTPGDAALEELLRQIEALSDEDAANELRLSDAPAPRPVRA